MEDNAKQFERFEDDIRRLKRRLPRMFGIEAVNLFKSNFDKEGFTYGRNGQVRKWKKTVNKKGGKTLTKTRRLRQGIHMKSATSKRVVISVDKNIPYAEIHNEGGKIPVTPKMRRYFWAMFKQTGNSYYKGLALTKKTNFEIPERQYIGNTLAMEPILDKRVIKELKKITSKY